MNEPIYSVLNGKVAGYVVSGAGAVNFNGTYCLAGTYDDKNYYQKGDYYLYWRAAFNSWIIQSADHGGLNMSGGPDYFNSDASPSDTPPTGAGGWKKVQAPDSTPSYGSVDIFLALTTC